MLKNTKKAIIIVQCIILIFSASFYSNANTKNINQPSSKEQPILDYTLEDLPNVIKNTILANENKTIDTGKKAECITTDNMNDLYSITVKNEDGSNTIYSFQTPIKYIENGKVKLKQPQLKESKKIMGIFGEYEYESQKNDINGYFPKSAKDGIKIKHNEFSLDFVPIISDKNPNNKNIESKKSQIKDNQILSDIEVISETDLMETFTDIAQSTENGTMSTAVSTDTEITDTVTATEKVNSDNVILTQKDNSEKTILYQNALSDNIDLEYVPTLNGIKENIILRKYENVNEFKFIINTNGLNPQYLEGDSIPLLDPKTGEMVMYIGQIDARDSYVGDNENDDIHFSLFNSLSLEPTDKNSEYILTVTVDKEFLESETTVYPVTIDPSISIPNSNTEDAPVYSGYPNSNFHTNSYNIVGYHDSAYREATTYVKTNCMQSLKYINPINITSAYYHVYEGSGKTSTAAIQVHDTSSTWNQTSITYANQPTTTASSPPLHISSSGWKNLDITDLTRYWLSYELKEPGFTQNFGFALKTNSTGVSSRHFCSANNSSYPPSVIINYYDGQELSDGVYNIRSKYSDLYLDTEQDPNANGNVIQYGFHGNRNQQWEVVYQGDGYYKLYSPWYNNTKCLDVQTSPFYNGANIDVYDDGPGDWLLFKIVSNNDGTYRIISKWSGNQKVLDVTGPSRQPGVNIQLWDYVGESQQKWYFERADEITNDINTLHSLAKSYAPNKSLMLTFQYMRSTHYAGAQWPEVAGEPDSTFAYLVYRENSRLVNLKDSRQYMYDYAYGEVDFTHLAAVANALLYNSTSFQSFVATEATVDDLSGWAGDLQTLVIETIKKTNNSSDYTTFYNKFYSLIGSPLSDTFSMPDLLADLDAIYIVGHPSSNLLGTQLHEYYQYNSQYRFSNFVGGRTKEQLKSEIYKYTKNKYLSIYQWPLYNGYTVSSVQSTAARDAFADYIWSHM